ncbi:MAG: Lrp/AsnC family transcriptional regulator [Thaumarchaeota archaeon]|nr:Lrp/AsnC family transcriptional regulator [Nitrososphaerota archaeon]
MGKIDDTDMKILTELVRDAGLSVPKLSKKINVNASVVYSRIKRLAKRGLIRRFTVEVDEELLGYSVAALIGINIDAKNREKILDELKSLTNIRQIVEVTGRFDIILDARAKSLDDLHEVVSSKIARIVGILHTETFIEMQRSFIEPQFALPK